MTRRPSVVITVEDCGAADDVDFIHRLRSCLKSMRRAYGLRVTAGHWLHQPAQGPAGGAEATAGAPDGQGAPGVTPGPLPGEAGGGVTT